MRCPDLHFHNYFHGCSLGAGLVEISYGWSFEMMVPKTLFMFPIFMLTLILCLLTILFLIILQIVMGSFLSGLNGGLIYNSWPDMNGNFFPDDITKYD